MEGDNGLSSITGAGTSEPVVGSSVPAWPSPISQLVVLVLRGSWGLSFECTTSTPKTLTTCGETSLSLLLRRDWVEQKKNQIKPAKKPPNLGNLESIDLSAFNTKPGQTGSSKQPFCPGKQGVPGGSHCRVGGTPGEGQHPRTLRGSDQGPFCQRPWGVGIDCVCATETPTSK